MEIRKIKKGLAAILLTAAAFFSSCHKNSTATPAPETGTMTDQDGIVYPTVKIGNQWWMAADLKAKHYLNGDSVVYAQTTASWTDTLPAYCIIDSSQIGLLYNWYAVNDSRTLAPAGWHIPSDQEWKNLEIYLGMSSSDADKVNFRGSDQGDQLKREKATRQPIGAWFDASDVYTVWPNNKSGFTAYAGSCRLFNGTWGNPGLGGTEFWWSSTLHANQAWYRYLDYNKSNVFRFYGDKRYGFSVRCIKN